MGKNKKSGHSSHQESPKTKDDKIVVNGQVVEALPGTLFKVKTEDNMEVLCTLSGKLRQNHIFVLVADSVTVEMSVYDPTRGRITWRR